MSSPTVNNTLLEVRLNTTVLYTIHAQLEHQIGTLDLHVQLEVQIVEFDAFGGRQASEKALGYCVQIGSELANVDQVFAESVGRSVSFA